MLNMGKFFHTFVTIWEFVHAVLDKKNQVQSQAVNLLHLIKHANCWSDSNFSVNQWHMIIIGCLKSEKVCRWGEWERFEVVIARKSDFLQSHVHT